MIIDGRKVRNCPFIVVDLGSQDCIIGIKWLKRFKLKLDTEHSRLIWPERYPRSYDPAPPLLMTLQQKIPQDNVMMDVQRRDQLWEKEDYRQRHSPQARIQRFRGCLKIPKSRICPQSSPPKPKQIRTRSQPIPTLNTTISAISANALHFSLRKPQNEFFTTSLYEINRVLEDVRSRDDPENARLLSERLPDRYAQFADVFSKREAESLPEHRPYDHKIVLEEPLPNSYSPLYKSNLEELEAIKKFVQDQLRHGWIDHSRSPFASPVLCVRKSNGSLRICVDYRKLNNLTRKDSYPIPRIDELLARPSKAKIFTKFDIRSAFNRIRMDPASEEYTTFRTRYGTYKCKVLPFGLCNGPATYQRYMNDVLIDYLDDFCIAYLDDILIYSEDAASHEKHVKLVLERLRAAGLQVDIKKSEFHVTRTKYLGYVLTNKGIEVDPEKVSALHDWLPPTTVTGVKSFLGFTGFYRQFVPEFSRVAKPLIALQSPANPFKWTKECQTSFDQLKESLLRIPSLCHFDPEYDTKLETDASDGVVAGVLSQQHPDKRWYPVAFYSRVLTGAELNWEIHDKELFAILQAFEKWRAELTSVKNQIRVYSDHRSLEYFMTTKVLNARQARWAEVLAPFNFRIEYTPGKLNERADILSRREQDLENLKTAQVDNRSRVLLGPQRLHNRINAELAQAYVEGPALVAIRALQPTMQLDSLELIEALIQANRRGFEDERATPPAGYQIQNGLLLYKDRLCVVPDPLLRTRLIREVHDQASTAHPSAKKTYQLVSQQYHWKGMGASCERYVRNCIPCRRGHPRQTRIKGYLHPLPIPQRPMQHLCMDFKDFPKDKAGYDQILVIIDRLTKQAITIPCHKTITARGMAELFIQWVYRFGHTPESIVSDRGPQFVSSFWSEFCRIIGVQVKLSTAYHKETDGQTEIMNKYIDQRLRPFVTYYQDNWSELLPVIDRAQLTLPHSSIGMSPYQVIYGSEPKQSWHWTSSETNPKPLAHLNHQDALALATRMHKAWQIAKDNMEKAQQRMRTNVDKHRSPVNWTVGDKVYLSTKNLASDRPSRKLSDLWEGPFEVTEQVGHSYRLKLPAGSHIHNVFAPDVLSKDPADPLPGQENPKPVSIPIDGVEEWEVQEILASKLIRGKLMYRTSWVGHDPDPTWYPAANFEGAPHKLRTYHNKYPNRPGPPQELPHWIQVWEDDQQ